MARASYSCEIEDVIYRLEGIAEVVVVGTTEDRVNEKMTAFVIASDNSLTEADIESVCHSTITGHEFPRRARFIKQL